MVMCWVMLCSTEVEQVNYQLQGEEKGHFIYEGQKYPFVFRADDRGAGVTFFTPDGKEVEDLQDFLSPLRVEDSEVLKNLQN